MTGDSTDTRIGRIEGSLEGMRESLVRLHADNDAFRVNQTEMMKKLDKIITERNFIVAAAAILATVVVQAGQWVVSHFRA